MTLTGGEVWTMATACLCGAACALLGCFLVLRRLSMLGDAISHAILPGLAGAFLLTGTRNPFAMLAGALIVGMLTTLLIGGLHRVAKVPEDASMGVVFSSLFALGVLLISYAAGRVDLDASCVLFGMIEGTPLHRLDILGLNLPKAFVVLLTAAALNTAVVLIFYKEIKLACFDSALGASMGFSAGLIHYGLMSLVAGTSVAAFESVGSVLVVAMLIAPGATALLLTHRFHAMLLIAVAVGVCSAAAGTMLAVLLNTSIPGCISVVLGCCFAVAVVLAPRDGLVSKMLSRASLRGRIRREDILGVLIRAAEGSHDTGTTDTRLAALASGWTGRRAVRSLRGSGLLTSSSHQLALTERGQSQARRILAAHRLWETYLVNEVGLPVDHVHAPAERTEHFLTEEITEQLRGEVKDNTDPQGRTIPHP